MRAALPASRSDWFSSRSRYHLIQRDLAHFGVERLGEHLVDGDCAQAVRDIELPSNAAAFGSMYVLEGSALGGQVIAKSAATTLGLGPDNGCAYFHGFHVDTAGRWKEFRALLESEVGNEPRARRQACDAARQTFDALTHMFERLGNGHTAARSRRMRG